MSMEILEPTVEYLARTVALAPRPSTLRGRVVGFLDGWGSVRADGSIGMHPIMEALKHQLEALHSIAGSVWIKKAKASSLADKAEIDLLVRECAAVVGGICLSGGCMAGAIGDAVELERMGVPTVTLSYTEFEAPARQYAASLGLPVVHLFVYQPPEHADSDTAAQSIAATGIIQVVKALTEE